MWSPSCAAAAELKDDIPLLVEYFLTKFRYTQTSPLPGSPRRRCKRWSPPTGRAAMRQLEHTVERAVIMARGGVITSQHLSLDDSEADFIDINRSFSGASRSPRWWPRSSARCWARRSIEPSENRHAAAKLLGIEMAALEQARRARHRRAARTENRMDNERGIEETWSDWDGSNRNVAVGTILASALVAA